MTPEARWPALLLQLRSDGWKRATDLAQLLGVSERTVYRDVHALVEAGVPIQGVPGKGYRVPDDYLLSPVTLSVDEAVMLVLGSAYAAQNFDGRYHASARAAQKKLEDQLSREDRERALTLQGSVHLVPPSAFGNPTEDALLQQIRRALLEERTLRLTGSPSRESSSADDRQDASPPSARANPYGLVRQEGTWYLVGYFHDAGRVRHVRLEDIRRIETTDDSFERPTGYRTETEPAPPRPDRRIRVVFTADAAPSVQTGPSVHVEDSEHLADGRLVLTLAVHDEREVMPWLLSWGTNVRVLEPLPLRRRLAEEAAQIADQYQDPPSLLDDAAPAPPRE